MKLTLTRGKKKRFPVLAFGAVFLLLQFSCSPGFVDRSMSAAEQQMQLMVGELRENHKFPASVDKNGEMIYGARGVWSLGFFPGILWNIYDYTADPKWEKYAREWTDELEYLRSFTEHHDVGFMVGCSFGNGFRLTNDPDYRQIIIEAAGSLSTRFSPVVGSIRSWDRSNPEQFVVVIENMMNLELLFLAYELTGDNTFYDIAISHADHTLKDLYREDGSCYHLVEYSSTSGQARKKITVHGGYSDESAWARGQAWGLYGFTMCYRNTKEDRYLKQAEKIADFILNHPRLPKDHILYWDFDAPGIPHEYRDASATAITASALLELSKYSPDNRKRFFRAAEKMLKNLSKPAYLSPVGENNYFILDHSVNSFPQQSQVDVPAIYTDYYFTEALLRYARYKE